MSINLNLFISDEANEKLEKFKKNNNCKNKNDALEMLINKFVK